MELLPKALGTRPRLAVEVRTEGVVAARAEDAAGLLLAIARADLPEGALVPGLKAGNVVDRAALTTAVRSTLDSVAGRNAGASGRRSRDVTVVVPDASVRVLLLDFDALPGKVVEALPVVRFRLKKLLPFEVEEAVVSYQIMSSTKGSVTVLAVAVPREVLTEYESIVTAAGYLPGAVLPSTLAALAGWDPTNASIQGSNQDVQDAALIVNAGPKQVTTAIVRSGVLLLHRTLEMNLVEDTSSQLLAEGTGFDRIEAEAAMQSRIVARDVAREEGGVAQITASAADEVAQAINVAAAYFEDTLGMPPSVLLSAGTLNAEVLEHMLQAGGLDGLLVRELMKPETLAAGTITASIPRGWLAGVRGALTS